MSYSRCRTLLEEQHDYKVSIRTLKRWQHRFERDSEWTLKDDSRRPCRIHLKITPEAIQQILILREMTGWGAQRLRQKLCDLNLSHDTINRVLNKQGLTRSEGNRGKLPKGVRFQRDHIHSLWHIDDSEFGSRGKIIAVIDDHSRYCLGILHSTKVTTKIVTQFLDELVKKFGVPRQIISDNGSPYGLKSKSSKFDKWCRKRND